jgi:D-alanyl-D-alanine carboxypeptidase
MAVDLATGASRRLRWAACALALTVGLLTIGADPADARHHRRKRPSYDPPYASIVVDANSGAVLQATNADSLRHPASLTKIMTLYLLFERLEAGKISLGDRMPVSAHAAAQSPTKLGLRPGHPLTVEDAILGLVTKSANDAAVVIAEAIGGTEADFARLMTRKARALGMRRTTYTNASGLPDNDQVTTARDQALLGRAIQERFPRYYHYFSTEAFAFHGRTMRNHNHLLGRVDGVDGIKTGYTYDSGFNLVTSMRRNGRHVVAVVLGGRSAGSRDAKMRDLLADHIRLASTRHTAPSVIAQARAAAPPVEVALIDAPLPPDRPDLPEKIVTADATASIEAPVARAFVATHPKAGSTDPIKPLLVKTVSIKPATTAAKGKFKAVPLPAPAPGAPETAQAPSAKLAAIQERATKSVAAEKKPARHKVARSGWMIQVGAFGDKEEARVRLSSAQRRAKKLLREADPFTEPVTKGDKTLYRARFAGLDRHQAEAACRALKRNDIACMTLKN